MFNFIVPMLVLLPILFFTQKKLQVESEKYYFLNIILYFFVSAVKINNYIPLGFMICLIIIFSHSVKNVKSKIMAVILGFCYFVVSVIIAM